MTSLRHAKKFACSRRVIAVWKSGITAALQTRDAVLTALGAYDPKTANTGMQLTRLDLENCHQLQDLTPLKGCPDLEHLTLPPDYDDITFLRRMPSLKTIGRKATPVEEFWRSD